MIIWPYMGPEWALKTVEGFGHNAWNSEVGDRCLSRSPQPVLFLRGLSSEASLGLSGELLAANQGITGKSN